MYPMVSSQMIRSTQAEHAQRAYMAEHVHAIRELRGSSRPTRRPLRRLAVVGFAFVGRRPAMAQPAR
jgi:hypothetical protein